MSDNKYKVAFVCVHNSCRSQMAEAITRIKYGDFFEPFSAGTEIGRDIDPTAIEVIKNIYGIDIAKTQKPKSIDEIPDTDIVITMGCNVDCPYLPCKYREDWGLEDPSGKDYDCFVSTVNRIEEKIDSLKKLFTDGTVK